MLQVRIHGIKDGKYPIDLHENAEDIVDLPVEFFGDIELSAVMTKLGRRYTIIGTVSCYTHLVCDLSLREYDDLITGEVELSYIANSELYFLRKATQNFETESEDIIINEDDQMIDLTEDIRQILILNLPMKRIHPDLRGKSFTDLYPELTNQLQRSEEVDEKWKKLKNLNLKN
ncbi:MAG TPA: DUF177 domain-containing protein [Bacteroidota bacterium]|nr:DUF177 domain-containing protein [Candidatus Kapabacteria bacterium]HRS02706.1 DUF177 domain-containing protein [Bacteroidota bacterium]HRT67509.1 DUF177 domain-containing protein [Bacteroidota bacterium]